MNAGGEREVTRCRQGHRRGLQSGLEQRRSCSRSGSLGAAIGDPEPVCGHRQCRRLVLWADSGLSLVDWPRLGMHKARIVH